MRARLHEFVFGKDFPVRAALQLKPLVEVEKIEVLPEVTVEQVKETEIKIETGLDRFKKKYGNAPYKTVTYETCNPVIDTISPKIICDVSPKIVIDVPIKPKSRWRRLWNWFKGISI